MTVTAPRGFRAAGVTAGLKASGRPDVALVVNDGPLQVAAAVLTSKRVQAAPVLWTRQAVSDGVASAVVLNSGGANACTGAQGFLDTHRTAEHVADLLGVSAGDVVVCSTGLIGELLPMDRITAGVEAAARALSPQGHEDAAIAIKTTDTVHKAATHTGEGWSVSGMAKGAGMLAPALATMLVVLTTDAVADAADLDAALLQATGRTFDRVDADGCMSTNDSVYLLASGASGVRLDPAGLTAAVTAVCADLAAQLVADAEGASKAIAVTVSGAASELDALAGAKAIARSALVKCAIHGEDPNWGRILAALGTAPTAFDPERVAVTVNGADVCRDGVAYGDPDLARVAMKPYDIALDVHLHAGTATATVLTTDLTAAYVHENSAYST
jgi:glutamate N-acetyltransferase / amino-acid N-acetyltransferase